MLTLFVEHWHRNYSVQTRSVWRLLMARLLVLSSHHQTWYWPCKMEMFPFSLLLNLKYLWSIKLRPAQNDLHLAYDIFTENFTEVCSSGVQVTNNISALVQIMAWHRQAIIWTNVGIVYWRIVLLGLNEVSVSRYFVKCKYRHCKKI